MRRYAGEFDSSYYRRAAEHLFNDLQQAVVRMATPSTVGVPSPTFPAEFSFAGKVDYTYHTEPFSLFTAGTPSVFGHKFTADATLVLSLFIFITNEDGEFVGMDVNPRYFTKKLHVHRMLFRSNTAGPDDARLVVSGTWNSIPVCINFRHRPYDHPEAGPPSHGLKHPRQEPRRNVDLSEHP